MSWTTFITKGFDPCFILLQELHVSPTTFVKTIYINSIVDIGTLRIDNTGSGILDWTASINVNWITMSFMSGNLDEFTLDTPIITIDSVGTLPGQYNGIITINSNAGTKDILVQMDVILPFGSVIRSAASPNIVPSGIGGDSLTIWHCDRYTDKIYELSIIDFSVVRSAASISTSPVEIGGPTGIGGDSSIILYCDWQSDRIYELSTIDLSVIRSNRSPCFTPYGIGGDSSTIWHCDYYANRIYELSIIDFSVIRLTTSLGTSSFGIGGDNSTIWYCDGNLNRIYELSTIDFSVIQLTASPGMGSHGIGGDGSTIWYCDSHTNKIYELSTG